MKKLILTVLIICGIIPLISACGNDSNNETVPSTVEHEHKYSETYSYNKNEHWNECSCGDKKNVGNHTYDNDKCIIIEEATESKEGSKIQACSVCRYENTVVIPKLDHTHNYSSTYSYDSENHWNECICGDKKDVSNHAFVDLEIINDSTHNEVGSKKQTCSVCGYERTVEIPKKEHDYSNTYNYDSKNHWFECSCGDKKDIETHNIVDDVCTICNYYKYSKGLSYTLLSNDTYEVTGIGTCKDTNLIIPDEYNGKAVTSIGKDAFSNCSSLESIVIPNSVTSIGWSAFYYCSSLENVYYEGSIEEWCSITFSDWDSNPMEYAKNFYILDENGTINYNGKKYSLLTEIEIPNTITNIGDCQFSGFNNVTSITIPNSVTSIGNFAFSGCINLTSVYYEGSIEEWCNITLSNAYSNPMYYYDASHFYIKNSNNEWNEVTEIEIPNTITSIGNYQFYGFNNVTSITIPNSVIDIYDSVFDGCSSLVYNEYDNGYYLGNDTNPYLVLVKAKSTDITSCEINPNTKIICSSAFSYCSSLESILIPNSVTSIGNYAFYYCSSLTSIEISNSVTSIGDRTFYNCSSLTSITIPFVGATLNGTSNTHFGYIFGASSDIDNNSYVPSSLKEVIITGGTSIGSSAFYYCRSLASIVIPNSVTSIGNDAFSYCSSLENVYYEGSIEEWCNITFDSSSSNPMCNALHFYMKNSNNEWNEVTEIEIPNTITSIGYLQFYGFNNVTSITIPNSVTSIGDYAFSRCSSLESIEIPNSVTSIGSSAFSNCSSLTSITIPFIGNTLNGTSNTHFGYIFGASSYSYNDDYVPSSLKEVIITGGTSIGNSAFYNCSSLTSIVIQNSVTSIGNSAFSNCSSLTSITIPNSATSIGERAFYNCSSLTSITIPNSATSIGERAFYNCSSLTSITIPNSVISIGKEAFSNCSSLGSVTIGNGVTSIGEYAFSNCNSLGNVYYEGSIEQWCNITFNIESSNPMSYASHFYMKNINNEWNEVTEIEIPNTITSIGYLQFYGFNNVTSITIPNSVTSISSSAFSNCSSLTSITIPFVGNTLNGTSNTHFRYIFGASSYSSNSSYVPSSLKEVIITGGTSIGNGAFYECSSLTSIVIPNSVTNIGDRAFYYCSSLTSIVIPNSVTSIGSYAFYECSSLTSIVIPNSVTSIGYGAFEYCSSLTGITIPNSVTSIGNGAFFECSSLENVYYEGSVEEWNSISIGSSNSYLTNANRYYYLETKPADTTNKYWHYVDGVITIWE